MKISHKLILVFFVVGLLIPTTGYLSILGTQKALQESVADHSLSLARRTMDNIDRHINSRVEILQQFPKRLKLQEALWKSNRTFEELDNIQAYIKSIDQEWTAVPEEMVLPFMQELINSELSRELREETDFYLQKHGRPVFGEVFVTNRYGANIAQTGRTTDYRQDDEEWWQTAKSKGLYVSDVGYDRSARLNSIDICIGIQNKNGNFAGVLKAVLNLDEAVHIVRGSESTPIPQEGRNCPQESRHFKLLTKDGRIIHATKDFRFLEKAADYLLKGVIESDAREGYAIAPGDEAGEGEKLLSYVRSKGHKDYKGLDWVLLVEHETEDMFAHAIELRNEMIIISLIGAGFALLIGFFFSRHMVKPIFKLQRIAIEIGKGNLDTHVEVNSNDEFGQLATSLIIMKEDLRESTTSIDNLNKEIAERKLAEEALQKSEEESRNLSRELSLGLNDVFEALQQIASGDPEVRLLEVSEIELIAELKRIVNLTAQGMAEMVDLSHEFAIGLAEHFDTLNRVSKGDLTARITGMTEVELLDGLKKVTNEMIESVGSAIEERKLAKGKLQEAHDELDKRVKERTAQLGSANDALKMEITQREMSQARQVKLVDELKQKNDELKDFAYIVSHDLKAPLRGIGTLANWLSTDYKDKIDEDGREQIDLLASRANRMQNLIDGILKYSRAGRMGEEKAEVDLNRLTAEVIEMISPEENIEINVEDKLPSPLCEKTKIYQVFQNLLGNAVKFMEKPKGQIRIGCVEENGYFKFNVTDNGPGIEEKYFDKIFKIFQTLSPRDEIESTGVGLSVVKKIIEAHGGKVWVESIPGRGSTFLFSLPKSAVR